MTVLLIVEEEAAVAERVPFTLRTEEEIRKAILAAVSAIMSDQPDVRVEWSSLVMMPLDGAEGHGQCVVCNRWVYDEDSYIGNWRRSVSRGAMVVGRFRCDEHLPTGHPLCFADRGYDGPIPE